MVPKRLARRGREILAGSGVEIAGSTQDRDLGKDGAYEHS
jgi:hypothetical protein